MKDQSEGVSHKGKKVCEKTVFVTILVVASPFPRFVLLHSILPLRSSISLEDETK